MDFDWQTLQPWIVAASVALVGRCVHYMLLVRDGLFRWRWGLLWDVPISMGTGVAMAALMEGLGVSGNAMIAGAALAGHLGPQALKTILESAVTRK